MKILKCIVSIICTIILSVSLIALSGLLLVRGVINKNTIMDIITQPKEETGFKVDNTELAYTETNLNQEDINNLDYNQIQSISKDTNKIHEILDQFFIEQGLPTELIDYIINDDDYKNTVSAYLEDYLNYTTGNGDKPSIDQNKVNEILDKNIAKYEQETNTEVDTEKIEQIVTVMTEAIDEQIDIITENSNIKPILNIIFSKKLLFGLIINCIIWIAIIAIINLNNKAFYYLSIASLFHGLFYLLVKSILPKIAETELELKQIIDIVINTIMSKVNVYLISSFVVFIILIVIGIILGNVNKKEKQNINEAN